MYIDDKKLFDWAVIPEVITAKDGNKYYSFPFKGYLKDGVNITSDFAYDMCETVAKNTIMDSIGFISKHASEVAFKKGFKEGLIIGGVSAAIGMAAAFIAGDIRRKNKEDDRNANI